MCHGTNAHAWRVTALLFCLCCVSQVVAAAETQFGINAGVGYSDNIRRTESNPQSETIGRAGTDFSLFQDSKRLYANVFADGQYLNYFHNTFDPEFVGNASALVNFRIAPSRFEWLLQDNFGQVRTDAFSPATPDNRENVNYLTTGPTFTIRAGEQARVLFLGRASNVDYQHSRADNNRFSIGLQAVRDLSVASHVSANAQVDRIKYKDAPASDFDNQQAYIRYELNGSRTQFNGDLGYNKIKQGNLESNGLLLRVDFARKLTASSTFRVGAAREFTDAANSFRSIQPSGGATGDIQAVVPTSNPFVSTRGNIGWEFSRQRTGIGIEGSYAKEAYELQPTSDRRRTTANVRLLRRLAPGFSLSLTGFYTKEQFDNTIGGFTDKSAMLAAQWQASRKIALEMQYQRNNRANDVAGSSYAENRAWLQVTYGASFAQVQSHANSSSMNRASRE